MEVCKFKSQSAPKKHFSMLFYPAVTLSFPELPPKLLQAREARDLIQFREIQKFLYEILILLFWAAQWSSW